jgi:hypothetical protein
MPEAKDEPGFGRPFAANYIIATRAIHDLEKVLLVIGMSGNDHIRRFKDDFISHGAGTLRASPECIDVLERDQSHE